MKWKVRKEVFNARRALAMSLAVVTATASQPIGTVVYAEEAVNESEVIFDDALIEETFDLEGDSFDNFQ